MSFPLRFWGAGAALNPSSSSSGWALPVCPVVSLAVEGFVNKTHRITDLEGTPWDHQPHPKAFPYSRLPRGALNIPKEGVPPGSLFSAPPPSPGRISFPYWFRASWAQFCARCPLSCPQKTPRRAWPNPFAPTPQVFPPIAEIPPIAESPLPGGATPVPCCRNIAWLFGVNPGFSAVPPTRGTSALRDRPSHFRHQTGGFLLL